MKHVVATSGGMGSWYTGLLVARERVRAGDELILLFSDTRSEDVDLYRFLDESSAVINAELRAKGLPAAEQVLLDQGEDIWDVFWRKRFLGNSRIDPCSLYLKRLPQRAWLEEHCDPASTVVYLGIDWTEEHRMTKAKRYWQPWDVQAPLCEPPYWTKEQVAAELDRHGIAQPALNREGFPHNNCGGGCVKAGQGQFVMLLEKRPEEFAKWERNEEALRAELGDVSILKDRRGGTTKPLPLSALRRRVEEKQAVDRDDIGGCGCAVGSEEEDTAVMVALGETRRVG